MPETIHFASDVHSFTIGDIVETNARYTQWAVCNSNEAVYHTPKYKKGAVKNIIELHPDNYPDNYLVVLTDGFITSMRFLQKVI